MRMQLLDEYRNRIKNLEQAKINITICFFISLSSILIGIFNFSPEKWIGWYFIIGVFVTSFCISSFCFLFVTSRCNYLKNQYRIQTELYIEALSYKLNSLSNQLTLSSHLSCNDTNLKK